MLARLHSPRGHDPAGRSGGCGPFGPAPSGGAALRRVPDLRRGRASISMAHRAGIGQPGTGSDSADLHARRCATGSASRRPLGASQTVEGGADERLDAFVGHLDRRPVGARGWSRSGGSVAFSTRDNNQSGHGAMAANSWARR